MSKRTKNISTGWVVTSYILLILFSLITILPVAWMIYSSFKPMGEIYVHPLRLPAQPTWNNYRKAFVRQSGRPFLNSLFYSGISTFATIFLALAAAFAISKFSYKRSRSTTASSPSAS